jgi:hypothetical protein
VPASREWRRYHRDLHHHYTDPALGLYGLPPGWRVQRKAQPARLNLRTGTVLSRTLSLPGHRKRVDRLGLSHRVVDTGAILIVESWRPGPYTEALEAISVRDLTNRAGSVVPAPDVTFPVDGEFVAFRMFTSYDEWTAFAGRGDVYIKIDSSGFPPAQVELVRVVDTGAYLQDR